MNFRWLTPGHCTNVQYMPNRSSPHAMGDVIGSVLPPRPQSNATLLGSAAVEPVRSAILYLLSPRPQAGFPSPAADYVENTLDLNDLLVTNPPATFFVRCTGESLIDIGILPGDILAVNRSLTVTDGSIVVAVVDGSLYVKRFRKGKGRMALVSENRACAASYPPLYFDECQEHVVWGVVTGVVRKL